MKTRALFVRGTRFGRSQASYLALALLSLFGSTSLAQTGNDNVTGPAGIFNGEIVTAGNYDPYTTNVRRPVTDIVVAGAVGTQPLALTRISNSRNPNTNPYSFGWGGWRHGYEWDASTGTSQIQHFQPTAYAVAFPDGRSESFVPPADGAGAWHSSSKGVVERFVPMNPPSNMKSYLLLNDGSKVEFTATESSTTVDCGDPPTPPCTYYNYDFVATALYDAHGLKTTLTYYTNGSLYRVTEPAGRWLQFHYTTIAGSTTVSGATVIDQVLASDARAVNYAYDTSTVTGATHAYTRLKTATYYVNSQGAPFNGETPVTATYTYIKPNAGQGANGVPLLWKCVDPMYAGPMWMIAYTYATANNPDGTLPVYGQIASENYYTGTVVGGAVSKLEVTNAAKRKEARGDLISGVAPTRTFTYTGNLLTSCTDFNNKSASQGYDANNFVNSVTDRNTHTTTCTRNSITGNATQVKFPATPGDAPAGQGTINYTYGSASCPDPNNKDPNNPYYVCTMTDEGGHITTYLRDTNKRVKEIDYPDGEKETFTYNGFGEILQHYLTTGQIESYTYDARGLKTEYRDPYHDPIAKSAVPNLRFKYDTLDRVTDVTDALGASLADPMHSTSFSYNARGEVKVTTHPTDPSDSIRHTVTNAYNTNGNGTPVSATDELAHVTSYVYDDYKRLSQVTTPVRGNGDNSVNTTTFNYVRPGTGSPYWHTSGTAFQITNPGPAGTVIANDLDANFRKTATEQAPGTSDDATTRFAYDNVGNLIQVQDPIGHLSATFYDERNRPYKVHDARGKDTISSYDAGGRKASVTRPNGQVITYDSYDSMNRLKQMTAAQSPNPAAVTKYTYDSTGGQLQTMTDPNNNVYTYGYDFLNRKTSLKYPDNTIENWTYDNTGNGTLYQFTNRAGNIETFTHDNLNRVTLANWNDGVTPDVTTAYDAASRVSSIANSNSTITRAYYDDNLLYSETNTYGDGIARKVTYAYKPDGRRANLTYPNNAYTFTYTYTGRGQLDLIKSGSNTVADYDYDVNGDLTKRTLDNATSSVSAYNDPLNRCTSVSHALVGTTRTFDYGYDVPKVDNLGWVKRDGNLGDAFDYDLNDQAMAVQLNIANADAVGAAGAQTINYDATGNRTSFAPPYIAAQSYDPVNNLNQYTKRNGISAGYDPNGNMTTGFDSSSYTYDAQNRLLTAKKGSGPLVTFLYDGLNRQIGKKIGGQAWYYRVYDGWDCLGEYKTGLNAATFAYLYGTGGIVKNVVTNNYYYQDGVGSTSHVAGGNGALKEYYRYDLQGQPLFFDASNNQLSDTAIGVRHLFTGQQWYNEIGLYDLRNRYYSPDIGRFLQSDPTSFGGDSANSYRYCGNNPVNRADPTGEFAWLERTGNNLTILLPINYTGSAASGPLPGYINNIVSATWTNSYGNFNVSLTAYTASPYEAPTNTLNLLSGQGSMPFWTSDHPGTNPNNIDHVALYADNSPDQIFEDAQRAASLFLGAHGDQPSAEAIQAILGYPGEIASAYVGNSGDYGIYDTGGNGYYIWSPTGRPGEQIGQTTDGVAIYQGKPAGGYVGSGFSGGGMGTGFGAGTGMMGGWAGGMFANAAQAADYYNGTGAYSGGGGYVPGGGYPIVRVY